MTGVLSGEPAGGDREPTPRASPCLEELGLVDPEEAGSVWALLDTKEYNIVDLLLLYSDSMEVYLRVFVGLECLEVLYLVVEACGDKADSLSPAYEWPEADRVSMYYRDGQPCAAVYSRPDPPVKARRLLERLGITDGFKIEAYRPVEEEEWRFEAAAG